jgi:hypothetical protein
MKRWLRLGSVALLTVASVLFVLVCVRHRYPVLSHFPGSCACTDYSEEIEGLTVFNPFRDRSPEASASAFLGDLRQGRHPIVAPDFTSAESLQDVPRPWAFEWRSRYRREQPHRVSLYYQFTRLSGDPDPRWAGEGTVEVVDTDGSWKASNFDVIW